MLKSRDANKTSVFKSKNNNILKVNLLDKTIYT